MKDDPAGALPGGVEHPEGSSSYRKSDAKFDRKAMIRWLTDRYNNSIVIAATRLHVDDRANWQKDAAYYMAAIELLSEPVLATPPEGWKLALDQDAAELLRDTIGVDEEASPITLSMTTSPDGHGLHVWLTEYPEEGSILLVATPPDIPESGLVPLNYRMLQRFAVEQKISYEKLLDVIHAALNGRYARSLR